MKALVYHGPNILKYEDIADVSPKAGEVKIRVKSCGICGSDVHGYLGLTGRRIPPMVMGHEFSGEIIEVGEGVDTLKVGDRVAPYPVEFCEACEMCERGDFHLCKNKKQFGVLTVDGAFAEYICVPAKVCFKLTANTSFDAASLMEPLAVSYRAVCHAGDIAGKTVLVVGAGTIGLLTLACVRMKGAGKIIVSDLSDYRLGVAKEMGADYVINPKNENLDDTIAALTDSKGVDLSFEAVGASPTVQQAVAALKFGGTAIWIGNNKPMIEINMQHIVTRELKIFGTFLYGLNEFKTVVDLVNEGKMNIEPLISVRAPLSKAADYFYTLAHDPGELIKVIINP